MLTANCSRINAPCSTIRCIRYGGKTNVAVWACNTKLQVTRCVSSPAWTSNSGRGSRFISSGRWAETHRRVSAGAAPGTREDVSDEERSEVDYSDEDVQTLSEASEQNDVAISVEKTSWNSRKLHASVTIKAPVELVWSRLTDYAGLGDFIPSLVQNDVLQKTERGAQIYQVGAQEVAMGAVFRAACTLDCEEWPTGIPEEMTSKTGDGSDGLLPFPQYTIEGVPVKDISFVLVKGDFKAFRGLWRLQPATASQASNSDVSTHLAYSLYVKPQSWLPVGLIASRIQKEVLKNLQAVQSHAEGLHAASTSASD